MIGVLRRHLPTPQLFSPHSRSYSKVKVRRCYYNICVIHSFSPYHITPSSRPYFLVFVRSPVIIRNSRNHSHALFLCSALSSPRFQCLWPKIHFLRDCVPGIWVSCFSALPLSVPFSFFRRSDGRTRDGARSLPETSFRPRDSSREHARTPITYTRLKHSGV